MGIEIVSKPTKMSFRIEDLAKSSRKEAISQSGDAIVYNVNFGLAMASICKEENTPVKCKTMTGPMTSTPISVAYSTQNSERSKRKRQEDSDCSDSSSIGSFELSDSLIPTGSSDDDERPPKRSRCIFKSAQVTELEKYYSTNKFMSIEERPLLSKRLGLGEHQVKTWFQNRRMKDKRQQKQRKNKRYLQGTVVDMGLHNHQIDKIGCQQNDKPENHNCHQEYMRSPVTQGRMFGCPPGHETGNLNYRQEFLRSPATQWQMFDTMSFMRGYGQVSPIMYPGYSHHCYNGLSPLTSQSYRV